MPRLQILTVEDDAAIRRGIVDALRFAGYEPLEAADGDAGLEMATTRQFDLLLDLVLPRRDGLESNTRLFREGMAKRGFNIAPGVHPICPIMLGDAVLHYLSDGQ